MAKGVNRSGAADPTAYEAMENINRSSARMRKALRVARMAIELCEDELRRR